MFRFDHWSFYTQCLVLNRTDPFSNELLPTDVPALLTGLQDGDAMSEEEM